MAVIVQKALRKAMALMALDKAMSNLMLTEQTKKRRQGGEVDHDDDDEEKQRIYKKNYDCKSSQQFNASQIQSHNMCVSLLQAPPTFKLYVFLPYGYMYCGIHSIQVEKEKTRSNVG